MDTLEADVIVVSLALPDWPAVAAAEKGMEVIAFEKDLPPGNRQYGNGPFAVESRSKS